MGNVRRKIELFFRGEFYLHLVTMFLIEVLVIQLGLKFFNYQVPITYLIILFGVIGLLKEFLDRREGKYFSLSDLIGTYLGGILAIIITY